MTSILSSHELEVEDWHVRVLNLETFIQVKKKSGFDKDKAALPILRRTLEEKIKKNSG